MNVLFIEYPKCSTCNKAKKYLKELGVEVTSRHIVEETPTIEELKVWYERSGLELKKFFNTSGNVYKEMKLKDKLPLMSEDDQLQLLSANGMLIKRPIVIRDEEVLVGFNEVNYKKLCS